MNAFRAYVYFEAHMSLCKHRILSNCLTLHYTQETDGLVLTFAYSWASRPKACRSIAPEDPVSVVFVLVAFVTFVDDVEVGDVEENVRVAEVRLIVAWTVKTI